MIFDRHSWLTGSLLGVAASLAMVPARADLTKEQCIDANAKGQDLFHDNRWTAAREQFHSCAAASCPKMLRSDCTKRLDDLDKAQPAIVFEAKDGSGSDLSAVVVTMDGVTVANKLDGTSLRLDPGEHVFVFTTAGASPVTRKLVLSERDQDRREAIVLGKAPASPVASVPVPVPVQTKSETPAHPSASSGGGMSTLRALGLVSGGLGVVALGVGGVFGVLGGSASSSQASDCASPTNCANHAQAIADHNTFQTDTSVEIAGFATGGALLIAGVVMFVAGGNKDAAKTGLVILPKISPGSAGLTLHGEF